MQILERSVTKQFWMKIYRGLVRKIQRGQYRQVLKIGKLKILHFTKNEHECLYAVCVKHKNDLRPIAWLNLWRAPGWKSWEVIQVFVFEKLRGQGLAKLLYKAAINTEGLIVSSGITQSKSSRSLWKSFVQKELFDIYAIDFTDLRSRSQVLFDKEHDELWCSLEIYSAVDPKIQDVRLIATRKTNDLYSRSNHLN